MHSKWALALSLFLSLWVEINSSDRRLGVFDGDFEKGRNRRSVSINRIICRRCVLLILIPSLFCVHIQSLAQLRFRRGGPSHCDWSRLYLSVYPLVGPYTISSQRINRNYVTTNILLRFYVQYAVVVPNVTVDAALSSSLGQLFSVCPFGACWAVILEVLSPKTLSESHVIPENLNQKSSRWPQMIRRRSSACHKNTKPHFY